MKYPYFAAWGLYVLMIAAGIVVRFGEPGIFACGDDEPVNLTFMSDPDWKHQIHSEKEELLQTQSCHLIRIVVDASGGYFGGYVAWVFLGVAGASRTPTWSPYREIDRNWKDI